MSLDAQRAARRAAMPTTTAFFEQYAEFSPTVTYAHENGITVGKQDPDENCFDIPPGYGIATNVPKVKK